MNLQRNIDVFLASETVVSSNWLANELGMSVDCAQKEIEIYAKTHAEVECSFLVTGTDDEGCLVLKVLSVVEVESLQSTLCNYSKSIYSIQSKNTQAKSGMVPSYINQIERLLDSIHPSSSKFLENLMGNVRERTGVKPNGERLLSSHNGNLNDLSQGTWNDTEVGSKKAFSDHKEISSQVQSFFSTKSTTKHSANSAASNSKSSKPTTEAKVSNEDEEWEEDIAAKGQQAKRVSTAVVSAHSKAEVTDVKIVDDAECSSEYHKPKRTKVSVQSNAVTHGAMDNYMEDVAIERFKQEQYSSNLPQAKKLKKVLVEKMFSNEKGYLVTEMVWEEIEDNSDTINCEVVGKSDEVTTVAVKSDDAKAKTNSINKPRKDTKASGGQKSMMSFFGKKS